MELEMSNQLIAAMKMAVLLTALWAPLSLCTQTRTSVFDRESGRLAGLSP